MQEDELIDDVFENVVSNGFLQALAVKFDFLNVTFPFFMDCMKGLCWRKLWFLLSFWRWEKWSNWLTILLQAEQPVQLHISGLHSYSDLAKYFYPVLFIDCLQLFSEVFVVLFGQRHHPLALCAAHARMGSWCLTHTALHGLLFGRFNSTIEFHILIDFSWLLKYSSCCRSTTIRFTASN